MSEPASGDPSCHWTEVYDRADGSVSWHQDEPEMSVRLMEFAGMAPGRSMVDVGGGTSRLAGCLLGRGGLHFIPADDSPTGRPMPAVGNEVIDSTALDEIR
ncbi:MAG: hypothetical protein HOV79_10835 [Hamadaea sp.]|nr:hypothetical protein [Hamadaea sp.]